MLVGVKRVSIVLYTYEIEFAFQNCLFYSEPGVNGFFTWLYCLMTERFNFVPAKI
jgi:hypothetical protein